MKRRFIALVAVVTLFGVVGMSTAEAAPGQPDPAPPPTGDDNYDVYVGKVERAKLEVLRSTGIEARPVSDRQPTARPSTSRSIVSDEQADELADQGHRARAQADRRPDGGGAFDRPARRRHVVFRPYSGAGGLKEEYEQIAAANPDISTLVTIGQTVNGQDIVALRVTKNAKTTEDGKRPATLFSRHSTPGSGSLPRWSDV